MTFGERLKQLREQAGLTQEKLGEKLNLSKANISKYESGTVEPNLATLALISALFGVTVDYLIGITDEKNKTLKVISLEEAANLPEGTDLTDTVISFDAVGTLDEIEKIESIMKRNGRYFKGQPIPLDETQGKTTATDERPLSEMEKAILELTEGMSESERNALLVEAARIIVKQKTED